MWIIWGLSVSAFILGICIVVDLNWKYFRSMTSRFAPSKVLMVLRLFQSTSTFIFAFIVAFHISISLISDLDTSIFLATLSALAGTIAASFTIYRKLTRLSPEETFEDWNLKDRIKRDVETVVDNAVKQFQEYAQSILNEIISKSKGWQMSMDGLKEETRALFMKVGNMLAKVDTMVEGYNIITEKYREKVERFEQAYREATQKYEEVIEKYQQLTLLEDELRGMIAQLTPMEPSRRAEIVEHGEELLEGLAGRRKGAEVRKNVAEMFERMGFRVEMGGGTSPDMLLIYNGTMVAVAASCAFTLTKEGTRQRRIPLKAIYPEFTEAEKLALPLIVVVTNITNRRMYGLFFPPDKLQELEGEGGITTPMALVEEGVKADRECGESVESLKEKILAETQKSARRGG